ncbi:MAG: hypothetical protein KKB79_00690 [Nanoarchaeota archaeon]|nr:hypothetical protein [Nanoarchaeota archaeon]
MNYNELRNGNKKEEEDVLHLFDDDEISMLTEAVNKKEIESEEVIEGELESLTEVIGENSVGNKKLADDLEKKATSGERTLSQAVDGRSEGFYLVEPLKGYSNVWKGSDGKLYRIAKNHPTCKVIKGRGGY